MPTNVDLHFEYSPVVGSESLDQTTVPVSIESLSVSLEPLVCDRTLRVPQPQYMYVRKRRRVHRAGQAQH